MPHFTEDETEAERGKVAVITQLENDRPEFMSV